MAFNSVNEFLGHGAYDRSGSGPRRLYNWRKRTPPVLDTVMHKKMYPVPLWQHGFLQIMPRENRQTREAWKEIWGKQFVCSEDEAVLKRQNYREEDGSRDTPPERCPFCRLIEYLRAKELQGLDWTTPVFRFEADGKEKILHLGGITGMFTNKKIVDALTREQKEELSKAKILLSEAWAENGNAKLSYIFPVVDAAAVQDGVQLAIETSLVKDKVKAVVEHEMKSEQTPELGDPWKTAYCIRWESRPQEQEFQKKFEAYRMRRVRVTPQIEELISGEPPDVSSLLEPPRLSTLKAIFESHCVLKDVPWDRIFAGPTQKLASGSAPARAPEIGAGTATAAPVGETVTCAECKRTGHPAETCPYAACDGCGAEMLESAAQCDRCGKEYKQQAQVAAAQAVPPPAKDFGTSDDEDGEIPF